MEISKKIIEIRKNSSMTQQQFAEHLFVTRQTISNWENERSYPDLESLILISDKFEVSLDELIKEDTVMVKKINFWVKNRRGIRNLLVITCLILFLSLMYGTWWLKYEADSINKIETKLEWDGYDQKGYYIEDRQYKINFSRQEN